MVGNHYHVFELQITDFIPFVQLLWPRRPGFTVARTDIG